MKTDNSKVVKIGERGKATGVFKRVADAARKAGTDDRRRDTSSSNTVSK